MATVIQSSTHSAGTTALLPARNHTGDHLPVLSTARPAKARPTTTMARRAARLASEKIVNDFRARMREAEDLVTKLGYNLRQIQEMWVAPPKSYGSNVISIAQAGRKGRGQRR